MSTRYEGFCDSKRKQYPETFSEQHLNRAFIEAFNNCERFRVLVDMGYDNPVWGYIGVTTGYSPTFLLMRRRGQHGSSDVISSTSVILDTKWIK